MEKKYQVFISSTYTDLQDERKKVRDAILSMYHFPVGMELFGAADEEQWKIIRETIDTSDFYVLIIGRRYGTVITNGPDAGISYTEKEFKYAREIGIPILAFVMDDNVVVKPENEEKDHIEEFNTFRETIKTGRLIDTWTNPDELATKVSTALIKQINRTNRPGWIRGDNIEIKTLQNEIEKLESINQELKNENERLKGQRTGLKPVLSFYLSNYGTRNQPINDGEELHKLYISKIEKDGYMKKPAELSVNDIRGAAGISSYDITDYNANLPTNEEIVNYNNAVYSFRTGYENGYHIKCELHNKGNKKANEASVILRFPKELFVCDWETIRDENPPRKPILPNNPIEEAKQMQQPAYFVMTKIVDEQKDVARFFYGDGKYPIISKQNKQLIKNRNDQYSYVISNGTVEVTAKAIMHKTGIVTCDFCIIPAQKGIYKIKAALMCEEYTDLDEKEISIIVE